MNLDRDLRDALRPLDGDPIADAERVLAALPGGTGGPSGPARGLPQWFWWGLGAVLAVGLAAGYLLGRVGGSAAPAAAPADDKPAVDEPEAADPGKKPPPDPMAADPHLLLMAFGPIAIEEPKMARHVVEPNQYRIELGTTFDTGDSMAGLYVYGNDARVRLATNTVATIDFDRMVLREGLLWVSTVNSPAAMVLEAELAAVQFEAAVLQIDRRPTGVEVTVLEGAATVRARGAGARRLNAMQAMTVDATGTPGEVVEVPFAGTATAWMTPMVLQQTDESELEARIHEMVDAFIAGEHRDAAEIELSRFGSRSVPALYDILERVAGEPQLLHRTAALIGAIADLSRRGWLFAMLESPDEELRAIAFRSLARVSREAVEDESFWRAASSTDRDTMLARWRERLK
ncbi:MAG: hypothetical protein KDC98_02900 [Planctomycetes bacterium]|nr:hypothetical protein [Planctomycetota bacterium]